MRDFYILLYIYMYVHFYALLCLAYLVAYYNVLT